MTRPVFLLTDFGLHDPSVGQVKAILMTLAPGIPIVDLTHEVDPFDIEHGAWLLEASLRSLPPDAVVLAVVDPGVGTERKGIVVASEGRWFVGPDNGLLSPAFPPPYRAGLTTAGAVRLEAGIAFELAESRFWRPGVAPTFHGRDVFAPVAARLASGLWASDFGPPLSKATILPSWRAREERGRLCGRVIHVDRFGNLITTIPGHQLPERYTVEIGGLVIDAQAQTYGANQAGQIAAIIDSSGFLSIAVSAGSAAHRLEVGRGAPVVVSRA